MRKAMTEAAKQQLRTELLAGCRGPTGYPQIHPRTGCQYASGQPPRKCECLALYSCIQRHADYGFDPALFHHDLDAIILEDPAPLDRYLADPARVWHDGLGCYIWGASIGIGKTTVAHQIVRRLYCWLLDAALASGHPAFEDYRAWYMLSGDMADRAHWKGRDGFVETWINSHGEDYPIDIFTVQLLVLDELGRENRDARRSTAGREMLEQMLRERHGKITILAGHDPPDMIGQRYGEHVESLVAGMTIVQVSERNGDRRRSFGAAS